MDQQMRAATATTFTERLWRHGWLAGAALLAAGPVTLSFEWPRQAASALPGFPLLPQLSPGNTTESPVAGLFKYTVSWQPSKREG